MPEVGDSLGRYTLLKRLAVGGMGEVYLAAKAGPVGFGPYVALKVLREELAVDRTFVDMLVDEANISMFLNHQNVVSVLDLAEDEGTYYIAMEYVQGITVERLMESLYARQRKLPVPNGLYVATELCRALKYAHTRVNHAGEPLNIVHRDVTPANILLSVQGEVKLTDFGIARARGRIHQTQAGVLKGKFGYMAPEMVRYEQIDGRADIFCAGVVIYLMVAGQHPVAGASVMEAIHRFESKDIVPPSKLNPEVPPELDSILMRALEPKPDLRWASAAALGDAIQDVILKNPAWRRESKDGAQKIVGQIKDVAPEICEEPVSRETLTHLLKKAREADGEDRSSAISLTGGMRKVTLQPQPKLTGPKVEEEIADMPTPADLERITPNHEFESTPEVSANAEIETDERLHLDKIKAARAELDEDSLDDARNGGDFDSTDLPRARGDSGARADDSKTMAYSAISDSATAAYEAIDSQEPSVDIALSEKGSKSKKPEPKKAELPKIIPTKRAGAKRAEVDERNYDEEVIDRELGENRDDGATIVGFSQEESEDIAAPTLAMSAVSRSDDSKTVAGMAVPDWEALDRKNGVGVITLNPGAHDDEDAATIIPGGNEPGGDATLLDGLDANQVQAALRAVREPKKTTTKLVRDESTKKAPQLDSDEMDKLVKDSVVTGAYAAVDPAAPPVSTFENPIRIVMGADGPLLAQKTDGGQAALHPNQVRSAADILASASSSDRAAPRPLAKERGLRATPKGGEPPAAQPHSFTPDLDVGPQTGRWMKGQIDGDSLDWSDDAAARRAVASRKSGPSNTPVPSVSVSGPGGPAAAARTPAPGFAPSGFPAQQSPLPTNYPPPPSSARSWALLGSAGVLMIGAILAVYYAFFYTEVVWPKLKLDSEPTGVEVFLDHSADAVGVTPVEVRVAPERAHLLEFRAVGYKPAAREITDTIGRLRTYTLRVQLERANPRLEISTDAHVLVNNAEVGVGRSIELNALPETGQVKVRVEAEGFAPFERTYATRGDLPETQEIVLEPNAPPPAPEPPKRRRAPAPPPVIP